MKAIILKNKITLVNDNDFIYLSIKVPFRNIQRMIDLTGCIVKSKKEIVLNHNHHAGRVALVDIGVRFSHIEKYLGTQNCVDAENYESYKSLFSRNLYYTEKNIRSDEKVNLYAFGDIYIQQRCFNNGIYQNKQGQRISLNNIFDKYINFKGQYYRLISKS